MYNARSHCVRVQYSISENGISPAMMATPSLTRLQVISSDFNFNLTLSSRFCRFSITLFRESPDRGVIIRYCWRQRKLYYEFSRAWLISPTFRKVRGLNNHPYGFSVYGTETVPIFGIATIIHEMIRDNKSYLSLKNNFYNSSFY